jgi:hypothetical protein
MKKRLLLLFAMVCALFFVSGKQSSAQIIPEDPDFCLSGWINIGGGCVQCYDEPRNTRIVCAAN